MVVLGQSVDQKVFMGGFVGQARIDREHVPVLADFHFDVLVVFHVLENKGFFQFFLVARERLGGEIAFLLGFGNGFPRHAAGGHREIRAFAVRRIDHLGRVPGQENARRRRGSAWSSRRLRE